MLAAFTPDGGVAWANTYDPACTGSNLGALALGSAGAIVLGGYGAAAYPFDMTYLARLDEGSVMEGTCGAAAMRSVSLTLDRALPTAVPVADQVESPTIVVSDAMVFNGSGSPELCRECTSTSGIVVSTDPIVFPNLVPGSGSGSRWLHLRNIADHLAPSYAITSLEVQPADSYSIAAPVDLPFELAGRESRGILVKFAPVAAGDHPGVLRARGTDAQGIPWVVEVALEGAGDADAAVTESFVMPDRELVDVIACVDAGPGMAQLQRRLGEWASGEAVASAASWRFSVVSSVYDGALYANGDVLWPGVALDLIGASDRPDPFPPKLHLFPADPANSRALFTAATLIETTDAGRASGCLEALRLALQPELLSDPVRNGAVVRAGGTLSLIIVSNRDDSSPLSVDSYVGAFQELRSELHKDRLNVYIAAPFDGDGGPADPPTAQACGGKPDSGAAYRYLKFLARFGGGGAVSVCNDSWRFNNGEVFGSCAGLD